tara:strand:+ start:158 stop:625 length:468 start_codon:yes stop_codon:yes gene_type:complete
MAEKHLLIVAHAPSENTQRLLKAVCDGAQSGDTPRVLVEALSPFDAGSEQILRADAIILGTTENLGYMSGALKDFFDRSYYSVLEETQGLPFCYYIRAGHDGTGTLRGITTITTGLRWRAVQEPLVCQGAWDEGFVMQCRDLGSAMAAGLDMGIF